MHTRDAPAIPRFRGTAVQPPRRVLTPLSRACRVVAYAAVATLAACATPARQDDVRQDAAPGGAHALGIRSADPSVIAVGDLFYAVESDGGAIYVRAARALEELARSPRTRVFEGLRDVWAPEIVQADGTFYIYFAAGGMTEQRMHVIASHEPTEGYGAPVRLDLPDDRWAIDGTAFRHGGRQWFVWSGWAGDINDVQRLYVAPMDAPTRVTGPRRAIAEPGEAFERAVGAPYVAEAPQPIEDPDGILHVVYSVNGSWSGEASLE